METVKERIEAYLYAKRITRLIFAEQLMCLRLMLRRLCGLLAPKN